MLKKILNNTLHVFKNKQFYLCLRTMSSSLQTATLPNGVKVVTEEYDSPLVCSTLFIETGSRFENDCNHGLSYLIEHMAYQGFTSLNKYELQETVKHGTLKMSALTTRDYQVFSAVGIAENYWQNVSLLSQIVTKLELSELEIELQKQEMYLEAIYNDDDSKLVVFDYLHQTAFQETRLAQSVMGPTNNICRFNKSDISCFLNQNYLPHRMTLVTSGRVRHANILQTANLTFGVLSRSEYTGIDLGPQRYTGSEIIYRNDSLPVAHIAIAVEVPGYNSPDYLPLLVASCLIDSWERTQGREYRHSAYLARAASTSSLCETFESFHIAYRDVGLWGIYFVCGNDISDMVYNIQDQWMHLCTTTHESDVARASNLVKMKLARNVDGVVNSCFDIGLQLMYTSGRKTLDDFYQELSTITAATVRNVASKYLYDKCPVVAAVGPTETLPEYNVIRSGMYWLRL